MTDEAEKSRIEIMRAAFHALAPELYRGEYLPTWLARFPDDPDTYGEDAGVYKHTCAQSDFEMFCEGWRAASNHASPFPCCEEMAENSNQWDGIAEHKGRLWFYGDSRPCFPVTFCPFCGAKLPDQPPGSA